MNEIKPQIFTWAPPLGQARGLREEYSNSTKMHKPGDCESKHWAHTCVHPRRQGNSCREQNDLTFSHGNFSKTWCHGKSKVAEKHTCTHFFFFFF